MLCKFLESKKVKRFASNKEAIYWLFLSFYFFIWFDFSFLHFSFLTRNWLPTSLKGFCLTVLEWLEDRSTQPENKRTVAQVDSTLNVEGGRQELCSQELSALGTHFFTLFFYCFLFVCFYLIFLLFIFLCSTQSALNYVIVSEDLPCRHPDFNGSIQTKYEWWLE